MVTGSHEKETVLASGSGSRPAVLSIVVKRERAVVFMTLSTNKFHRISQGHCLCAQQSIILIHRVHGLKIETLLRRSMRKLKKTILI